MIFRKIQHAIQLLLAVYLLVFFFIVLPIHHHEDLLGDHDGCAICFILNHPGILSPLTVLAVTLAVVFIVRTFQVRICFFKKFSLPLLRSPPAVI